MPELFKTFSGPCLILGSGSSVFGDIENAKEILSDQKFDVIAVNLSFLAYNGPIQHLISLHQERMPHFHELARFLPEDRLAHIFTHSHMDAPGVGTSWPIPDQSGTSSLFAVKVAILLGYTKIILCGVPLSGSHRFYDNPFQKHANNFSCPSISIPWKKAITEIFNDRVRSMSGKSLGLLGAPTKEWVMK